MTTQTFAFQTEVKALLRLMIHSLYSHKEIFLRELISNGSDAIDKLRFESLANPALFENDPQLQLSVLLDKKARTITVMDNGIGMSHEEVIQSLGTIAQSGTQAFIQALPNDKKEAMQLIGQFGVGFYSVFMVAQKVVVRTRRAGLLPKEGVLWESTGEGEYQVSMLDKEKRGTEITLYLKDDEEDFLFDSTLRRIIKTYSDHIPVPIQMKKATTYDKDGQVVESDEMEVVNQASALWMRKKEAITTAEYEQFYQHISADFAKPLAWTHAHLEGKQSYSMLLYIPTKAPFDLYHSTFQHQLKLYVKRIFIMEAANVFLPHYLRFVKGVIDSDDLPLNVSREILQASKDVEVIKGSATKKTLDLLEDMAKERPDDYGVFWQTFGQVLKEGIVEDVLNQGRLAKLLRFYSNHATQDTPSVSLAEYLTRMKSGQDKIYFLTADTLNTARHSPHLEIFNQHHIEVLLLVDKIDEWMMASLLEFEGKSFQSIAKGEIDLKAILPEVQETVEAAKTRADQPILEKIKEALGECVCEVRATTRLIESPACLVVGEKEMSPHLQRLLKDAHQTDMKSTKPILEVNPNHPLVKSLLDESSSVSIEDISLVLYDQALLMDGGKLENPSRFITCINRLIQSSADTASTKKSPKKKTA